MTDAQKWFSTGKVGPSLQQICTRTYGSTRAFKFPAETRFAGKLLQIKQFFSMKLALRQCVGREQYTRYNFDDDIFAERIEQDAVWNLQSRFVNCTGPLLLLVRLGDMAKGTLSKLKGTVDYVGSLLEETGDGSLEDQVAAIFHDNKGDLESDVANAAYCIDPQFVSQSKDATTKVMDSFWKVSRQILGHAMVDSEWLGVRTKVARELQSFRMKSAGFAFEDYSMEDTTVFWGVAGCHGPTLQKIALALAPLPCSSSSAERNWFELKCNKTKVRNRMNAASLEKIVFVRRFLRIQDNMLKTKVEDADYKQWVKTLLRAAAAARANPGGDGDVSHGGNDPEDMQTLIVFNDVIEEGEQRKINGKEGRAAVVCLSQLRKDNSARSWLFEKYFNMCFVDKNPEEPDPNVPPLADPSKWEHRQIINVVWARYSGHVVDTVIIDDDSGDRETYVIDEVLMQMIRASPNNTRQIKSVIPNPANNNNANNNNANSISGDDSDIPIQLLVL